MSQPIVGIVSSNELIEKGTYKKPVQDVNDDYLNMISMEVYQLSFQIPIVLFH